MFNAVRRGVLATATAFVMALPVAAEDVGSRLRTEEPQIRALIAEGLAKSPTFASLAAALDQTDVIVHVRSGLLDRIRGRIPYHDSSVTARDRRVVEPYG
jgi:hypothetical protein